MHNLPYYLVDVFTDRQFGGNPLAVFPNADDVSDSLMQKIAKELNLAETTFIQSAKSEHGDCTVRIFTPKKELPIAGHPTIGTAFTVLTQGLISPKQADRIIFDEGVGPIAVEFEGSVNEPKNIRMHQPVPEFKEIIDKDKVAQLLSLSSDDLSMATPAQVVSCGVPFIIVHAKSLEAVKRSKVRVDLFDSLLTDNSSSEFLIFTQETEERDSSVHCRMYAPVFGIPEDPATGSAHGPLGGYLVKYDIHDGASIRGEQGYEMGRPSIVEVSVEHENKSITDITVGGNCVAMGEGVLHVNA